LQRLARFEISAPQPLSWQGLAAMHARIRKLGDAAQTSDSVALAIATMILLVGQDADDPPNTALLTEVLADLAIVRTRENSRE
jgi:hypothetical protein